MNTGADHSKEAGRQSPQDRQNDDDLTLDDLDVGVDGDKITGGKPPGHVAST